MTIRDVDFGGVEQPLVVLYDAFVLNNERFLRCQLLFGNRVLCEQRGVPGLIYARIFQQSLIASKLPFSLQDGGFIRARIDFDQRIALFYQVTFVKVKAHQLTVNAALHGHRIDGSDGPKAGHVDADIACDSLDHRSHGNWPGGPSTALRLSGLFVSGCCLLPSA